MKLCATKAEAFTEERKFRPYADNILVLPDWLRDRHRERRSAGGIVMPTRSGEPRDYDAVLATVIAAGPGAFDDEIRHDDGIPGGKPKRLGSRKFVPCQVKAGDRVLVQCAVMGEPWIVDGMEHRVIRANNVVGVVEEEAAGEVAA